jgi:hypothetical protein
MDYIALIIDLETGSFTPKDGALIEIGYAYLRPDLEVEHLDSIYILPQPGKVVSKGAADVNGYTPELWEERGAVPLEQAVATLTQRWHAVCPRPLRFAGSNCGFDIRFMEAYTPGLLRQFFDITDPLDAMNHGREFWRRKGMKPGRGDLSVSGMLSALGYVRSEADAHGGFEDVHDTAKLFKLQRAAGLW